MSFGGSSFLPLFCCDVLTPLGLSCTGRNKIYDKLGGLLRHFDGDKGIAAELGVCLCLCLSVSPHHTAVNDIIL